MCSSPPTLLDPQRSSAAFPFPCPAGADSISRVTTPTATRKQPSASAAPPPISGLHPPTPPGFMYAETLTVIPNLAATSSRLRSMPRTTLARFTSPSPLLPNLTATAIRCGRATACPPTWPTSVASRSHPTAFGPPASSRSAIPFLRNSAPIRSPATSKSSIDIPSPLWSGTRPA